MAGVVRGNVYRFDQAFIWRAGSDGIGVGQLDPDLVAGGTLDATTSHAKQLHGTIDVNLPQFSYDSFSFLGGTVFEGTAQGGISAITDGTMNLSQLDGDTLALLRGGLVDTSTISNTTLFAPNYNEESRQFGLLLVSKIQSRLSGSAGTNLSLNVVLPKVEFSANALATLTRTAGENTTPLPLTFNVQSASVFPMGVAFSATQGWKNNENFMYYQTADNGFAMTAFVQDGLATTYTTEFKPALTTVTGGNTDNSYTVGGVPTAPTSHNATTGVVTLAVAGSASVVAQAFYQTNYEAV
jgi:hypothetical protein